MNVAEKKKVLTTRQAELAHLIETEHRLDEKYLCDCDALYQTNTQ